MSRMVYLIGQPGAGKSTLMARLTEGLERLPSDLPVPHDRLFVGITGSVVGAEIGKQRGAFSGTDALASAIIDRAAPWVRNNPYPLMLAEGARLANRRFLTASADGGYEITLALLDHQDAETWRAQRSRKLGRSQNASWVAGRRTASVNLAAEMELHPSVTVLRGHPDELYADLAAVVGEAVAA